jgi:hypothetical protein
MSSCRWFTPECPPPTAATMRSKPSAASASKIASIIGPTNCPAASANAWPSPAPSPPAPPSSWQTNRPGNLDSRTGEEIMGIFDTLWRAGNTILVVTHEEMIARHARRIVRLRDGHRGGRDPGVHDASGGAMNFWVELSEGLRIAWDAIRANKLRSLLTTLGIIIGVVTVTLMGTVIDGLNRAFTNSIAMLGADTFYISRTGWFVESYEEWKRLGSRPPITLRQARQIQELLPPGRFVAPVAETRAPSAMATGVPTASW